MQKIVPHLWFDKEAVEAAEFYTKVFPDSKITHKSMIKDTPSGDCDIVGFNLMGYEFMSISAGPYFKINPSISFHVKCKTPQEVDNYYEKLSENGKVLMELSEYPFSKRYAWVEDKFGVSWQIILTEENFEQNIVPALLFTQDLCGKSREAIEYYVKVFPESKIDAIVEYGKNEFNEKEDNIMYSQFKLANEEFIAMDSGMDHKFKFNEAISFIVNCKDQKEIDHYWDKLSAVPESEQCGWVKDKFGVSWQITPENMNELLSKNPEKTTPIMLKMKKIIITELEKAGEE